MGADATSDREGLLAARSWPLSGDAAALLFIALCWIAAIVLVNPIGEFPSVDDWAYLNSVRALVERGEIVLSDWSAPNLISHLLWGALFAVPFGVSYTTLRISTLVAALLCAFALYKLLRAAGAPISLALFGALLLLFNPIFFALSFTYMTDVPYVAAQTGAMLFLFLGLRSGSAASSAFGWLFALLAQFSRQTGLAIPFAWGGAYLVKNGVSLKHVLLAALPLVVFLGLQWGYEYWLDATGRLPLQFGRQLDSAMPMLTGSPAALVAKTAELARNAFFYLGLFLLPMSLPVTASLAASISRKAALVTIITVVAITAIVFAVALRADLVMPIWPHTWRASGLGYDGSGIRAPLEFFQFVTLLSAMGGVLLLICLVFAGRRALAPGLSKRIAWPYSFALLGALAMGGILVLIRWKFDRYLLPILPWLALAIAFGLPAVRQGLPLWVSALSSIFLAGMATYSIVNVHNYAAEKRAIAKAIDNLVAQGVARDTIDGTWPFNGELFYGRYGKPKHFTGWYRSRDYVVGFRPEPGHRLLQRSRVPRWRLWGGRGLDIFTYGPNDVLQRPNSSSGR